MAITDDQSSFFSLLGIASKARALAGQAADAVASGTGSVVGELADGARAAADSFGSRATAAAPELVAAAGTVADFGKGVAEGAYEGLAGIVKGVAHVGKAVAKEGYALATDAQARSDALATARGVASAVGDFATTAATDPGKALDQTVAAAEAGVKAAGQMAHHVADAYHQAAAEGHAAEFIGKAVGQTGILVAGAVLTDGASLGAEGAAVATEGVAIAAEGTAVLAEGTAVVAEGATVLAEGTAAVAEGTAALGEGTAAVAEGTAALTEGTTMAAEGSATLAEGSAATAEGSATLAEGSAATAEGSGLAAEGGAVTTEGATTSAEGAAVATEGSAGEAQLAASADEEAVTVYRVEGKGNQRLSIDEEGNVDVPEIFTRKGRGPERNLYLNFGDEARANEFLQQRLAQFPDNSIKSFKVPKSFLDELRSTAVKEAERGQLPGQPVIADPTKASDQFGLGAEQIAKLRKLIIPGSGH